uniref:hypothetical protein n=1 Tax=Pedobacter schmidteae TaxID=2201271 RepID=UPI000EAC2278|nr:hypothetical protein [Pedobacter schmidteae]
MFKKLTGLFILLCFFLVKSTPLFAAHQHEHQQNVVTCCADQNTADQNAGENEDSQKECKQFEIADEDFIGQPGIQLNAITLTKKLRSLEILCVPAPYIALPYPPPNFL